MELTHPPAELSDEDRDAAARVDSLVVGRGYIGRQRAGEVAAAVPEARARILDWLRASAGTGDWRRFERLACVALHLHPEGLGSILAGALEPGVRGVDAEELVDLLGELRAPEGVEPIRAILFERRTSDGPLYALCLKAVQALGEIGTPEALECLGAIATAIPEEWPAVLRRYSAEELGLGRDVRVQPEEG
ncbi:hypothetical protein [Streptomyces sp. NPDC048643]|uniref:hypothetical protein n=1 Tax=Streptomyces sp. NPDC048643 TaxID=3155637 RepID=UPI00342314CC